MRVSIVTCIAFASLAVPFLASAYPVPAPEDYEMGCSYDFPINWNSDYPNTSADCMAKVALAADAAILDCAWGTPEGCVSLFDHLAEVYSQCFPAAHPRAEAMDEAASLAEKVQAECLTGDEAVDLTVVAVGEPLPGATQRFEFTVKGVASEAAVACLFDSVAKAAGN